MRNNVRSKISGFLTSEEGRVSVKSPLALGAASVGLLLAHAMVSPSAQAHMECWDHNDCNESQICVVWIDDAGEWHSQCEWA